VTDDLFVWNGRIADPAPVRHDPAHVNHIEAAHSDVPIERSFDFITEVTNWSKLEPEYLRLEEGLDSQPSSDVRRRTHT
jgi:hypothetical protein